MILLTYIPLLQFTSHLSVSEIAPSLTQTNETGTSYLNETKHLSSSIKADERQCYIPLEVSLQRELTPEPCKHHARHAYKRQPDLRPFR